MSSCWIPLHQHRHTSFITPAFPVSSPTCLLNSLLQFGTSCEKPFFGVSLASSRHGGRLLTSSFVSVGGFVSAGFSKRSHWSGICRSFGMARFSLRGFKSDVSSIRCQSGMKTNGSVNQERSNAAKKVAFFDVDGTITRTNVVLAYYTHRITELPFILKLLWIPWFAVTCIFYLIVDSVNRAIFNRIFYLSYRGRSVESKTQMAEFIYRNYYRPRIFSGAVERIQSLKNEGYQIVFVTGCLDFLIAPLAQELGADFVYAAELVEENGKFTGKLKGMASSNAEKADRVKEYAAKHGISLEDSLAFGDSVADLPMLEVVGHPHVVNPDARLQALAEKRGWPIINWGLQPSIISAVAA